MPPSNIATAADYADAMMIARRAKNLLFCLLMILLLLQLATFFVARFTNHIIPDASAASMADTLTPATQLTTAATQPLASLRDKALAPAVLRYFTALTDFLGIVFIIVLSVVLLLIVKIMLVGRLIGVAQVTSAFCWCVFLGVLLFPWQAFLQNTDFTGDFKLPGVLYTWRELIDPGLGAKFSSDNLNQSILRWARFVGWPVFAIILLLMVQAKSSRGLRAALGETELDTHDDLTV
jgi:hypothetical protein